MSSTVIAMLLAGGMGVGVLVLFRAVQTRPIPLSETISSLQRPRPGGLSAVGAAADRRAEDLSPAQRKIGRLGIRILESVGFADMGVLREQLRVLDKPLERHAYEKLLAAVVGFLLPSLAMVALAAGGVSTPPPVGLGLGLLLGLGGFLYPDLPLGEQVARRQQAFRHAFSSYLDLVTIILAGGGGIESALTGAADAGGGWAFEEIRTALRRAELTGRTPWELFDEIGVTLGVDELRELAASVSLAGGHGAKIRSSLAAKADALRAQQAAEVEANAEARTEKMIVPVTVMIVGLTLFIGYGAVQAISTDGGGTFNSNPIEHELSP